MPNFVLADSNILLRLVQPTHAQHAVASSALDKLLADNVDLCVVTQNIVEFWAVATRPAANLGLGMTPPSAAGEIQKLRAIFHLLDGGVGIADAWEKLVRDHLVCGKQTHDAHLAAAMSVYGIQHLLTFNGDDFRRYAGITVLHPAEI